MYSCRSIQFSRHYMITSVFSVEISIHGLKCWRITRHSEYIIHESRLFSWVFPILACVAWRFCREHDWAAKPQNARKARAKKRRSSRPSLLAVSLYYFARPPKPPCYAGYPDSRSVYWSIHGSRETPSRSCQKCNILVVELHGQSKFVKTSCCEPSDRFLWFCGCLVVIKGLESWFNYVCQNWVLPSMSSGVLLR